MDLQLLRTPAHDQDALVADREPRRWPGKSSLTSKLAAAPQLVFRVADPDVERTLNEALRPPPAAPTGAPTGARAPVMRRAEPLSADPFAVHLSGTTRMP